MGSHILIDITGQTFGRLTVIRQYGKQGSEYTWLCKCTCGNTAIVFGGNLRAGRTKSCGCLHDEMAGVVSKTHGMTGTRPYRIWKNMKNRCYNERTPNYKYYGAKGISVCDEWRNSFVSFYNWSMAHGYSDDLTIDRIDGAKGYSPDNCRWTDLSTQNKNRDFSNFKRRKYKNANA